MVSILTFYNGLIPSLRNMLDASSSGDFLSKSYEEGYKLIESITANTYQWKITRASTITIPTKPTIYHEVTETITLAAQVAQIHQMMKSMMISFDTPTSKPYKVVIDVNVSACVYCGGAHLFGECSNNPVFVNYVGKDKYNKP